MATASFTQPNYSNPFLSSLVSGFSFSGTVRYYLNGTGWNANNAASAFEGAIAAWAAVADISFERASTPTGSIDWTEDLYNDPNSTTLGSHYYPNNSGLGGEFNAGHPIFTAANNLQGGLSFVTFLHELGHGLGLNHPFEDNPFPGVTVNDPYDRGDNNFNNGFYTVMAYDDDPWFAVAPSLSYGYAGTPMAFDIAAAQAIYGANLATATGNDTYLLPTANQSGTFWTAIWDAGGTDTISGVNNNAGVTIDLRAATLLNEEGGGGRPSWQSGTLGGNTIYGGFVIANNAVIENAIGSAFGDEIIGNEVANNIAGGAGADTIDGKEGNDIITGGTGIDTLTGGAGADTFVYASALDGSSGTAETITDFQSGQDKIDLTAMNVTSFNITNSGSVYTLTAVGVGGTLKLAITATSGFVESDVVGLPGGTITGTTGADTINGSAAADVINGLSGHDTIMAQGGDDIVHGDNGNDIIYGNAGNDELYGDAGLDTLYGGDGNDILDGGTSADTMRGEAGNDTYYVNQGNDVVIETSGQGTDTVVSSAPAYTLTVYVENLTLAGSSVNGYGNGFANTITGNSGNNILAGYAGDDILLGGAGNDQLQGGTGNDQMTGGLGNDRYVVNNLGDTTTELSGQGLDTVATFVDWTLGVNIEFLLMFGTTTNGTGNNLNNSIIGNNSANTIRGLSGDDYLSARGGDDLLIGNGGRDTLTGGTGADRFKFNDGDFVGGAFNQSDRIVDFNRGQGDKIDLSGIDAIAGGGGDAFTFIGTSAFSNTAGELRYEVINGRSWVSGDTDGDGNADIMLRVDQNQSMVASDFVL